MNAKRTPGPWHIDRAKSPNLHWLYLRSGAETVATLDGNNRQADSNFIALACNSHDALVAALRELLTVDIASEMGYAHPNDRRHAAQEAARAALAKAGEA